MKTLHRTLVIAVAFSAGTSACSQNTSSSSGGTTGALGPTNVATINGKPLPESVLRVYALTTEGGNLEDLAPDVRQRLIDELIGVALLTQEAEKAGLSGSRTVAAQVELQRLQLVARAQLTSHLEKNPPTEEELRKIYEENLPRLSGEQYKTRHILVPTEPEAARVIERLRAGQDFVAIAQEHADGPTGPNGGSLDWLTTDSMPPAFAAAVRTMTAGSYSAAPVQTEYGFHVILLEETRKQEPPGLEEVRSELVSAAERNRVQDYLKSLRDAATVKVEP
jgi:peptidyl-prolyl cis-trans isomerase C